MLIFWLAKLFSVAVPQENPPLGEPFILAFDQDNKAYPIIAVPMDPRDKTIPTVGTATGLKPEWQTRFPNNKFTVVHVNPGQPSQRVWWMYERLPGPLLSGQQTDNSTGIKVNFTKQRVLSGSVSGGIRGAGVVSLSISNPGSGFTAGTYSLGFSGGGGTGAAGTYTVTAPSPAGKIGSVALVNSGAGFTGMPTATISGGGGTGATVTVVLTGSTIASLVLGVSGSNFVGTPIVTITDSAGTGSGATGTALLSATSVASGTVTNAGTGYTSATAVISGGGGTGATATVTVAGNVVTAIVITAAGTGYTSTPTITISGDGTGATAAIVLTATSVASVTLTATGSKYQNPGVSCTDGTGNAAVTALLRPTSVSSLVLSAAGSGYSAPVLAIAGGGGTGATGTATLATGSITGVAVTLAGVNYTGNPTVTTPSGGGTGAVISAVIGDQTYVDVQPQSSVIDLIDTVTVDRTTVPTSKRYPVSIRVQRTDIGVASLIIASANGQFAVGMRETNLQGGSGPVLGYMDIHYLTDSQYAAFDPGIFSITGNYVSYTLDFEWADPSPHVFTGRATPVADGTSAGVMDVTGDQMQYGMWKVRVIGVERGY